MSGLDELIDAVLAPPPARGRRPAHTVQHGYKRDITEADIKALWDLPEGGLGSETRPLVRLRFQHHYLAKLVAEGRPEQECALVTGYAVNRISILKNDPAFAELVAYYKSQTDEVYLDVHQRLAALGLNSVEELMERLDESPEAFTHNQLMELAKLTLDRAGFGPTTKVQHEHKLGLTSEHISRIKQEISNRGQIRQIAPQNSGVELGPVIDLEPMAEAPTEARSEGEGSDV